MKVNYNLAPFRISWLQISGYKIVSVNVFAIEFPPSRIESKRNDHIDYHPILIPQVNYMKRTKIKII